MRQRNFIDLEAYMQISEIMTPNPELIEPTANIREAAKRMRSENVGALPVGENDRLVGMITDRDIVTRAVAENCAPESTSVREAMSGGIFYCFDDEDVEAGARSMAEHQVRRLPVLNRNKRLVGIIAVADIARAHDNRSETTALEGISERTDTSRREIAEPV
jgi:CBS domain-containing protein